MAVVPNGHLQTTAKMTTQFIFSVTLGSNGTNAAAPRNPIGRSEMASMLSSLFVIKIAIVFDNVIEATFRSYATVPLHCQF
jgi:hypothetical protein